MDIHSTLIKKGKALAAKLRSQGAEKVAPENEFGIFKKKGDMIYLVGETQTTGVDLDQDYKVQKAMLSAMRMDLVSCVQEVAENGVFEALLRAAFPNSLGFDITTDSEIPEDEFLFHDPGTCAIVTVSEEKDEELVHFLFDHQVTVLTLGHVTKGDIRVDDEPYGNINDF